MAFTITNPINTDGVSAVPGKDNRDLGLKLYSNMVLEAFDKKNVGRSLVTYRMITSGVSSQFLVAGEFTDADVSTHTPGADVDTKVLKYDEVDIKIEDKLYVSTIVDKLDEKLSHFDHRATLARQRSSALSDKLDKTIFTTIDAAISATPKAGQKAATVTVNTAIANATTLEEKGNAILESIFVTAGDFNKKNVPTEQRYFVTTPDNYQALVLATKSVDKDYTNGNGGIDEGSVMKISGVSIIWTNNLPGTADVEGYMLTPDAVGLVSAMEVESEGNYLPEKLGWLLTDVMAYGIGVLDTTPVGVIKSA
jgi:hypothetical protein